MKITFSPLVAAASGKTAHLVGASWKGRAYVRKLVTPSNPNTDAQKAVRNSMTLCVKLCRDLLVPAKTWLNLKGKDTSISGFNLFMKLNRKHYQLSEPLLWAPPNPYIMVVKDFAYDSEPAPGQCKVKWTALTPPALCTNVRMYAIRALRDYWQTHVLATVADASTIVTGLTVGGIYHFMACYTDATETFYGTCATVTHTQLT